MTFAQAAIVAILLGMLVAYATERFRVESRMEVAAIGSPETVRQQLDAFQRRTGVDELMLVSDVYDHALRLRSFEIAAEAILRPVSK